MIRFAVETWAEFYPDAKGLMPIHWAEIALNRDKFELAIDEPCYQDLDARQKLLIITARDQAKLVGYYLAFLVPHPHYCTSGMFAMTDIYYLLPQYRKGGAGLQLLLFVERIFRERKVTKGYISHKVHQDHQQLFELLGWELADKCYIKVFI